MERRPPKISVHIPDADYDGWCALAFPLRRVVPYRPNLFEKNISGWQGRLDGGNLPFELVCVYFPVG